MYVTYVNMLKHCLMLALGAFCGLNSQFIQLLVIRHYNALMDLPSWLIGLMTLTQFIDIQFVYEISAS
jgi:hypothetical protein